MALEVVQDNTTQKTADAMIDLMTSDWNVAEAERVADALIRCTGLRDRRCELISFRQNALFHLPENCLTIRVYNPDGVAGRAELMVRCARWLEARDFPAVRLAGVLKEQPAIIRGYPVSVWRWIDKDADGGDNFSAFGNLLRQFHDLPAETGFAVPDFDPLAKIRARIDRLRQNNTVEKAHLDILEGVYERAERLAPKLDDSKLGRGLVHGDALRGNAIRSNGKLHLIDFDSVCLGPREWDLAPTALTIKRFGVGDDAAWTEFLQAYGAKDSALADLEAAIIIKELSMTVFLCLSAGQSCEIDKEIEWRIAAWKRWDLDAPWHPLSRV